MVTKQYFENGLNFITVRNRNFFEVTFCSLGASIYDINYHFVPMVMGVKKSSDFKPELYYGKTIGRVAGRIKDGRITIDDKVYFLAMNEGTTALHGGYFGLSTQTFAAQLVEHGDYVEIIYTYTSYHLESGFPGTLNLKVTYKVFEKEDTLKVEYEATSDNDTVLNLTNHAYFCLGTSKNHDLVLKMNSSSYITCDDKNLLPLEEKEIEDEIFDFKNGMAIKEHVLDKQLTEVKAGGYDHMFIVDKEDDYLLSLDSEKYHLDIYSSYDAVQIYSDNIIDNVKVNNSEEINHRALAIEPQKNQLGDISLKAFDVYKEYIEYRFKRK